MLRNKIQGLEATDPDFPHLSLAERRRKLRVRTYIRLEIGRDSGRDHAIVTDLSLDGLRLRRSQPLIEGEKVEVYFPDGSEEHRTGAVRCRVVWVQEIGVPGRQSFEAGLSFEDSRENMRRSWVKYVLEQLGFDENKTFQKRKFVRAHGKIPARAYLALGEEFLSGQLLNLGVGGALLELDQPLEKEQMIHCEICLWRILPALRLPCKVLSVTSEPPEPGGGEKIRYHHCLLFLGMDIEQVKLLGNYVIFLINQTD